MQNGIQTHTPTIPDLAIELCHYPGHGPHTIDADGLVGCDKCDARHAAEDARKASEMTMTATPESQADILEASVTYTREYKGNTYTARVLDSGGVVLTMPSGATSKHSSLSAAASAVTDMPSLSGPKFWNAPTGAPRTRKGKAAPVVEVPLHVRVKEALDALIAPLETLVTLLATEKRDDGMREACTLLWQEGFAVCDAIKADHEAKIEASAAAEKARVQSEAQAKIDELARQMQAIREAAGLSS